MAELEREFGSHTSASVAGWKHTVSYGEFIAWTHATAFMNANRDTEAHPDPVELPTPWPDKQAVDVTPEERARLRADLEARSAFAH
ncbi:hypothetical protein QE430_002474 [Microbacterium testaceum]|uniref:hypothetical protein n=1 Tax=Microbacterium testaceum TaxID=2033 RepID=UPI00277E4BE5|nr:hypothetical protein [Microbacterium testaceum]MDQ1174167.1 hypothetical protein [Microbacterium testaceum]